MQEFTRKQELEILNHLDSKAEMPLKFNYLGGFDSWIKIAERSREEGTVQSKEEDLKLASLSYIFRELTNGQSVNIIDFGPGDGVPMLSVIGYLQDNFDDLRIKYIPIDISQAMLDISVQKMSDNFPDVEIKKILGDFEDSALFEDVFAEINPQDQTFAFLLGNTLGNFHNTESLLQNITSSLFSDNTLVIGNEISNLFLAEKLLKYYAPQSIAAFTTAVLKRYKFSFQKEDIRVKWNAEKKQIEGYLSVPEDTTVEILDNKVFFETGEEILLFVSKKFSEDTLLSTFASAGLRIDFMTTNKAKDVGIFAVRPTRYKS